MIACLRVPYFATTVEGKALGLASGQPLYVVQYRGGRGKVLAVNAEAEAQGVVTGMAVSRARALCPTAQMTLADPQRYRQAWRALLALVSQYSQWIEIERGALQTAILYVDLGKLKPSVGQQIGHELLARLYTDQGFSAALGLAANKFTASAAAQGSRTGNVTLVARGDEAAFLAPQPTHLLPLTSDAAHRLHLFGLHTLGQLAALPRSALIAQFGKAGGVYHRLALGEDTRRVARYLPRRTEQVAMTFDEALTERTVLHHAVLLLANRVAARLESENLTCREVRLTLHLEGATPREAEWRLRTPQYTPIALYHACQQRLAQMALQSGVAGLELQVSQLMPRLPQQLSLFDWQSKQELRVMLQDLAQHYQQAQFYTAVLSQQPSYLPELRFHLEGVATE